MKNLIVFFLGIAILSIGACTRKVDIEADIKAIKNLTEEYDAAINSGDLDSWMSFYADDAVRMQPNMPALFGKDSIRSVMQSFFENYTIDLKETTEEVIIAGDWAFAWGTYNYTITPKVGGEPSRDSGKWVTFDKRQPDGSWKCYRNIYNSNLPPSGVQ